MQNVSHAFIITKSFLCMKKMGKTEKWQLHQGGRIVVQLFLLKIIIDIQQFGYIVP